MDKKVWCHPFASDAVKRKFWKRNHNPGLSVPRPNALSPASPDSSAKPDSRMEWVGLFGDPALHVALDRIIASNGIA